ncbi:MAG: hypothetical protein ABSC11_05410 [Smithella sp.]|jgi:hypothetical protein
MKKIITHILAVLIGLILGFSLSFIHYNNNYEGALNKARTLYEEESLVMKLGDINLLIKEGYPEAAKILDAGVYLRLGSVGNYYKQRKEIPTELDWILINPAIDYIKKIDSQTTMFYTEAAAGIVYLKEVKGISSKGK